MHLFDVVDTIDVKKKKLNNFVLFYFCRLFEKTPDFNEFFNFWTFVELILTLTFSTLIYIYIYINFYFLFIYFLYFCNYIKKNPKYQISCRRYEDMHILYINKIYIASIVHQ